MSVASLLSVASRSHAWGWAVRWVGGGLVGLLSLVWAVEHAGPWRGTAIVHVAGADAEVRIGGWPYFVPAEATEPLLVELPAGEHEVSLIRDGKAVLRRSFRVEAGRDVMVTLHPPTGGDPRRS